MAQPQKYEREADFTKNHGSIQNDSLLNSELDDIALTVNGLRDRQALILKDDDSVKNGIFGIDQLTPELRASLDKTIIDADDALKFAKKADEQSASALQNAQDAVAKANQSDAKADTAISTANSAKTESENALSISQSASETANTAKATAESVVDQYNTAINTANNAVATAGQATNNANTALETANTAITTANTARTTATNAQTIASNYAAEIINYENRIDATVANIPAEVDYAVNAKNIPGLIATEVQNALQNVEVAGLTYDTITGALGFAPADSADLTAEESARSSADATLQANITAETNARTSAISAEATARQNADNALQTKIDNIGDNLATVASSGSYNDLLNKPTIPTVPTKLSQFTDDLGANPTHTHSQYLTQHQSISHLATIASLTEESTARANADSALQGQIDDVSTVANNALANTLPPQTGQANKVLGTDGTSASWVSPPSGRNLHEWVWSSLPLTDAGLHLADGAFISFGGVYDKWARDVERIKNAGLCPDSFVTQAEFDASVSAYGSCGKFVVSASGVRLPKVSDILQGTTDLSAVGDLVEAGLPNIVGTLSFTTGNHVGAYYTLVPNTAEGAFYASENGAYASDIPVSSYTSAPWAALFSASRSSPYYKGSVQKPTPQTIKSLLYICVATSVKTPVEANIDNVMTDVNNKLDRDFANAIPSKTFKSNSIGWGLPDYTTGIQISGSSYTATYKCWLIGWTLVAGAPEQVVKVNGAEIAREAGDYASVQIPLDVGDVVTVTSGTFRYVFVFAMKGNI